MAAEKLYQIFDVSEKALIENSITFDGARTFVAGHWDILEDEEQYNKIMASGSVDQLNNYAEGLDFIIEEQGVDFE